VRYYDVDGGKADGQVLVGRITLIQSASASASPSSPPSSSSSSPSPIASASDGGRKRWLVEISELEDVGDGYYAEYPYRKRPRPALRMLEDVAPLPASFVRSEDAYKVPLDRRGGSGNPMPSHPGYDVVGFEGPTAISINDDVLAADGEEYARIKLALLRDAAMVGFAGAVFAGLFKGPEYAVIYGFGALAGVGYLFLLGIKTDTLGGANSKLGSNVSNLRFLLPVMVLVAVAARNASMDEDANPVIAPGLFSIVTPGQFGAAMIGFLTYRVPLFASQLAPVLSESVLDVMPGSAAMAMRMASDAKGRDGDAVADIPSPGSSPAPRDDGLVTILLVSGPEGTGKTTLVNRLLMEDDRFVRPLLIDRMSDGAKFERMQSRGEFLDVDDAERYGLTREGILNAAKKYEASATSDGGDDDKGGADMSSKKVVVVDADVSLARKLLNFSGARLIGVWIGLDDIDKFEKQLKSKIASGGITIPDGETEEAVLRSKVRQVVKDIEFGVVSG
jgi:hypothetical protein